MYFFMNISFWQSLIGSVRRAYYAKLDPSAKRWSRATPEVTRHINHRLSHGNCDTTSEPPGGVGNILITRMLSSDGDLRWQ
jgi:hypothetical protein